jgi:hypothetical protein
LQGQYWESCFERGERMQADEGHEEMQKQARRHAMGGEDGPTIGEKKVTDGNLRLQPPPAVVTETPKNGALPLNI